MPVHRTRASQRFLPASPNHLPHVIKLRLFALALLALLPGVVHAAPPKVAIIADSAPLRAALVQSGVQLVEAGMEVF